MGGSCTATRRPAALAGTHSGVLSTRPIERHLALGRAGPVSDRTIEFYGPPKMACRRLPPAAAARAQRGVRRGHLRARVGSTQMRTDFVANISHELKTPVGALAVLAETLSTRTTRHVVRRVAERMVAEAHRVGRTIDDLLELSRIELGAERSRRARARRRGDRGGGVERVTELADARADHDLDGASRAPTGGSRVSAIGASSCRRSATWSRTRSSTASRARRSRCARAPRSTMGRDQRRRPGRRHPAARPRPRLRALLPRRPGAQPRRPAAPGSGWRSCATSPATTAATCRSRRVEGEGSTFVLRLPDRPSDDTSGVAVRPEPSEGVAMTQPTVLVVEDEASFVEALADRVAPRGLPGRGRHATVSRRSSASTRSSPTSCCST